MWDGVFEQVRPGLLACEADLARAEGELGFPLPASYRTFALDFGAGRIGDGLRIFTPGPVPQADLVTRAGLIAHAVAHAIEALAANPLVPDAPHRFRIEGEADAALTERASFFGEVEGAFLFFDVQPGADEYAIWVLAPDLEIIRFGGPDLAALVRALQGEGVTRILGPGASPLPATFAGDDVEALGALAAEGTQA